MRAEDYRYVEYAELARIDISGTVLPQHEANGAWRPERAEDWAFLAEAWGEREMIDYIDASPARTPLEIGMKDAEIVGESFMHNLKVAQKGTTLFSCLERMLKDEREKWCARAPIEREWNEDGAASDWWTRCPEMYPERQLSSTQYIQEAWRWEAANLRAAFADLAANERYVCSYWYDVDALRTMHETSTGESRRLTGPFKAGYQKLENAGSVYWVRDYPDASTLSLKLPQAAGTPVLATLWHAKGTNAGVDKWYVKNVAPDGITPQFMEAMLPQMTGSDDDVWVNLESFRLVVPITLRTRLN